MNTTSGTGRIYHVTADKPHLIDEAINAANELAQRKAIEEGRNGILVTRHGPASFTVAVSVDVPYGITQEREHCRGRQWWRKSTRAVCRTRIRIPRP